MVARVYGGEYHKAGLSTTDAVAVHRLRVMIDIEGLFLPAVIHGEGCVGFLKEHLYHDIHVLERHSMEISVIGHHARVRLGQGEAIHQLVSNPAKDFRQHLTLIIWGPEGKKVPVMHQQVTAHGLPVNARTTIWEKDRLDHSITRSDAHPTREEDLGQHSLRNIFRRLFYPLVDLVSHGGSDPVLEVSQRKDGLTGVDSTMAGIVEILRHPSVALLLNGRFQPSHASLHLFQILSYLIIGCDIRGRRGGRARPP